MRDHHVDRPGVYGQQCPQLTGPNRPIDLIPPHHAQQPSTAGRSPNSTHAAPPHQQRQHQNLHPTAPRDIAGAASRDNASIARRDNASIARRDNASIARGWLRQPGGHGGGPAPDPIPNSDVKTTSAHDTAPQGAGKSVAARSSEPTHQHTTHKTHRHTARETKTAQSATRRRSTDTHAGWSSPVARQAHNLKVTGSNPVPATPFAQSRGTWPRGKSLRSGASPAPN